MFNIFKKKCKSVTPVLKTDAAENAIIDHVKKCYMTDDIDVDISNLIESVIVTQYDNLLSASEVIKSDRLDIYEIEVENIDLFAHSDMDIYKGKFSKLLKGGTFKSIGSSKEKVLGILRKRFNNIYIEDIKFNECKAFTDGDYKFYCPLSGRRYMINISLIIIWECGDNDVK